jgi:serine/threonine protein kinase
MSSGLAPSRRLGRYTVVDCIGRGGMGEVWLATVEGPGGFRKQVVLKTVRPDLAEREDLVDSLIREAALAARLSHPNLVQVFDLDCVADTYFFAMEYVPGRTLAGVLREAAANGSHLAAGSGRIPAAALAGTVAPWFLASVVASACDGLHHAHELVDEVGRPLGLVHRDVSPGNIMVANTGNVVVLDFGIAVAAAGAQTETGVLKGKFQYMSPERIRGTPCDRRCDVYALGVILYLGLTGHSPYTANGEYDLIQQIASGPPPMPSTRRPLLPVALERICMTAMAYDPGSRYPDASALAADLRDWLRAQGEHPTPDDVSRYMMQLFGDVPASGPPRPPTDLSLAERSSDVIAIDVEDLESVALNNLPDAAPSITPRRIAEERIATGAGRLRDVDRAAHPEHEASSSAIARRRSAPTNAESRVARSSRAEVATVDRGRRQQLAVNEPSTAGTDPATRDIAHADTSLPDDAPAVRNLDPVSVVFRNTEGSNRASLGALAAERVIATGDVFPDRATDRPPERTERAAERAPDHDAAATDPAPVALQRAERAERSAPPPPPPAKSHARPRPVAAVDEAPFTTSLPRSRVPLGDADDPPFTTSVPRSRVAAAIDGDAPFTTSLPRREVERAPTSAIDPFEAAPKPERSERTAGDIFEGSTRQRGDSTRWPWSR